MTRSSHTYYILNPNMTALDLWDALNESLSKASSLASFTLTESIAGHLSLDLRNYLWALNQFILEACEINHVLSFGESERLRLKFHRDNEE